MITQNKGFDCVQNSYWYLLIVWMTKFFFSLRMKVKVSFILVIEWTSLAQLYCWTKQKYNFSSTHGLLTSTSQIFHLNPSLQRSIYCFSKRIMVRLDDWHYWCEENQKSTQKHSKIILTFFNLPLSSSSICIICYFISKKKRIKGRKNLIGTS